MFDMTTAGARVRGNDVLATQASQKACHKPPEQLFKSSSQMSETSQRDVVVVARDRRDQEAFGALLSRLGCRAGYCSRVQSIADGARVLNTSAQHTIATIICHRRQDGSLPFFDAETLPGHRLLVWTDDFDEATIIGLLEQGAHQCFGLDENPRVMQERLAAALREHRRTEGQNLVVDDIVFDVVKRKVWRAGEQIDLSPKEHDLAYYLFKHRDRVVGNSELMTSVWSLPQDMDARRIDTAACRLRKKLGLRPERGWHLKRLRTVGYRLLKVEVPSIAEPHSVGATGNVTSEQARGSDAAIPLNPLDSLTSALRQSAREACASAERSSEVVDTGMPSPAA